MDWIGLEVWVDTSPQRFRSPGVANCRVDGVPGLVDIEKAIEHGDL